jgi:hydroxymethylpyrimidine/phosphomethylpyrimidine kinase
MESEVMMMSRHFPVLLSVAGYDPSGGAGVLLDTAVMRRLGFRAVAVVTAVTVQNTAGVRNVHALPAVLVRDQWQALAEEAPIAGIKIGMLGTAENARAVIRERARHPGIPCVVDPVFRSSSGARLLEPAAIPGLLKSWAGRATLLTPNLDEAAKLSGLPVRTVAEMEAAARFIYERTAVPCLVKGGHLKTLAVNVLFDGVRIRHFVKSRLAGEVHGTGCYFSSALTAFLAQGRELPEAVRRATEFTHRGIRRSLGRGKQHRRFVV